MNFCKKTRSSADLSNVTCYNSRLQGYYMKSCPTKKEKHNKQVHSNIHKGWEFDDDNDVEYIYHQTNGKEKWDKRLLIESHSTFDIFKDKGFLKNIHMVMKPCKIKCDSETILVDKKGFFGSIPVWYHPNGVANIMSCKTLKKLHQVTYYNSDGNGAFKVHTLKGVNEFKPYENGLHYLDLKYGEPPEITFVQLRENYQDFTKKEIEGGIKAREMQVMLSHPSQWHARLIANCLIIPNDISTAYAIFGENLAGIRGKTVQRQPERVVTDYVKIPRDFFALHKFVTLTADVMFVNGLAFVIAFGRGVGLITAKFTPT